MTLPGTKESSDSFLEDGKPGTDVTDSFQEEDNPLLVAPPGETRSQRAVRLKQYKQQRENTPINTGVSPQMQTPQQARSFVDKLISPQPSGEDAAHATVRALLAPAQDVYSSIQEHPENLSANIAAVLRGAKETTFLPFTVPTEAAAASNLPVIAPAGQLVNEAFGKAGQLWHGVITPAMKALEGGVSVSRNPDGSPRLDVGEAPGTPGQLQTREELEKLAEMKTFLQAMGAAPKVVGGLTKTALSGIPEEIPQNLYKQALRPSGDIFGIDQLAKTGLSERVPVGRGGLNKVRRTISSINDVIDATIKNSPRSDNRVSVDDLASALDDIKQKFTKQANPQPDIAMIDKVKEDVLNHPMQDENGTLSMQDLQEIKKGTYQAIGDRAYDQQKGAGVEAEKGIGRKAKTILQDNFPELQNLNQRDGRLIELQDMMSRRIANLEKRGLKAKLIDLIDNPYIKSKLAILINDARRLGTGEETPVTPPIPQKKTFEPGVVDKFGGKFEGGTGEAGGPEVSPDNGPREPGPNLPFHPNVQVPNEVAFPRTVVDDIGDMAQGISNEHPKNDELTQKFVDAAKPIPQSSALTPPGSAGNIGVGMNRLPSEDVIPQNVRDHLVRQLGPEAQGMNDQQLINAAKDRGLFDNADPNAGPNGNLDLRDQANQEQINRFSATPPATPPQSEAPGEPTTPPVGRNYSFKNFGNLSDASESDFSKALGVTMKRYREGGITSESTPGGGPSSGAARTGPSRLPDPKKIAYVLDPLYEAAVERAKELIHKGTLDIKDFGDAIRDFVMEHFAKVSEAMGLTVKDAELLLKEVRLRARKEALPVTEQDKLEAKVERMRGQGEIPWFVNKKTRQLEVGKVGEDHFKMPQANQDVLPGALRGRVSKNKNVVAVWEDYSKIGGKQKLSDALFDLVLKGHAKKDSYVYFSDGEILPMQRAISGDRVGGVPRDIGYQRARFLRKPETGDYVLQQPARFYGEGSVGMTELQAQPFYSELSKTVGELQQERWNGTQLLNKLRNTGGVKQEEIKWTGLDDFLKDHPKVTRQEVSDFLKQNEVKVGEVVKGEPDTGQIKFRQDASPTLLTPQVRRAIQGALDEGHATKDGIELALANDGDAYRSLKPAVQKLENWETFVLDAVTDHFPEESSATKFGSYQLPGSKEGSYRELLLTLPGHGEDLEPRFQELVDKENAGKLTREEKTELDDLENMRNRGEDEYFGKSKQDFRSPHFDEPNVLAHIRFNERTVNGRKTLFIEELQSDWHQRGRKEGYANQLPQGWKVQEFKPEMGANRWELLDENGVQQGAGTTRDAAISVALHRGVPNAPFKSTWHELALRRMLRYAAEKGYKQIAWTTGEQQAARYDLSKHVTEVAYDNLGQLHITRKSNEPMEPELLAKDVKPEQLADYVGKEVAKKIIDKGFNRDGVTYIDGIDLKVGGEGMKGFYDKILVDYANKFGKKFGATTKTIPATIDKTRQPVHVLPITPEMKRTALKKGFPTFSQRQTEESRMVA